MLSEEILDKIQARLQHLPLNTDMISATDTDFAGRTMESEYEVRHIQVTEKMVEREHVFVIGFCGHFMTMSLTQNLQFLLMKHGFI